MASTDLVTEGQIDTLTAATAAAHNGLKGRTATLESSQGTIGDLSTSASTLVGAINEVASAAAAGTGIDDSGTSTTTAWSSSKTASEISAGATAATAALVDAAPAALDTLNELAAALGDDPAFASTTTTALGNRLRIDVATQGLSPAQRTNGLTNLGIARSTVDFAAAFNAAIA